MKRDMEYTKSCYRCGQQFNDTDKVMLVGQRIDVSSWRFNLLTHYPECPPTTGEQQ